MRASWAHLIGLTIVPLAAGAAPCTKAQEIAALNEAVTLRSWAAIHRSFKRYGHCDVGAIAEGYSESVSVLLSDRWDLFPKLGRIVQRDRRFAAFVLRHIDETSPPEQLQRIRDNAQSACPREFHAFCGEVAKGAMTANNASERISVYRGRAVLAMDCVLAGAERAPCLAAQLSRWTS